jgi:thioredoxin-dependent peroxiredoxin
VIVGVSPDSPKALKEFREKRNLPFELLSDPEHKVIEAYGAWGEKKLYGKSYMGVIRSHVIIDEKGRIVDLRIKVSPDDSVSLAVEVVTR